MAKFFNNLFNKRTFRSSDSSDDSTTSPEAKKPKKYDSPLIEGSEQEEDEVMTALNMLEEVAVKVQRILEKLETIELSLKKIESKLAKLETRMTELEVFKEKANKDINELKDGANFAANNYKRSLRSQQSYKQKLLSLHGRYRNMKKQLRRPSQNACILRPSLNVKTLSL